MTHKVTGGNNRMYNPNNCGSYTQTEEAIPLALKFLQTSRFALPVDEQGDEQVDFKIPLSLFKDRLRYLIAARHLTQATVARDIGYSEVNLSRWVSGKVNPRFGPARALAKRFRVSLEWLFDGEGHTPTPKECFLSELKDWKIPQIDKALEEASEKFEVANSKTLQAEINELKVQKIRAQELIDLIEKNGESTEAVYLTVSNS